MRLRRARTFDEIAESYDRGRRRLPDPLFDDLFARSGIEPHGANVLEIGCGTGQATAPLAGRGCRLVCVEMGANLARFTRDKLGAFPNVTVIHARFEDFDPEGVAFDLVFASNAWHWLDPRTRYAKTAALLKPAGALAFTTSRHAFPPGFDPFFSEIQDCYEAIGEARLAWPPPRPEEVPDAREEIEASGCFEGVQTLRYIWSEDFSADEYIAMIGTASDHRIMAPDKRERLFAEMRRLITLRPDGRVRRHMLAILQIARKRS